MAAKHLDAESGDLDGDGDHDLVTSMWGRVDVRRNNGGTFAAPVRAYTVPSGGGGRAVSLGDADGDGDLDIYALISNRSPARTPTTSCSATTALTFSVIPVPPAPGIGDAVTALDGNGDGRTEFLVLNGVETSGPAQRIELRFQ